MRSLVCLRVYDSSFSLCALPGLSYNVSDLLIRVAFTLDVDWILRHLHSVEVSGLLNEVLLLIGLVLSQRGCSDWVPLRDVFPLL